MVGRRGRDRGKQDRDNSSALGLRSLPLARKLAYFDGEFERLQRERRLPASRSERLRVLEPLLRCGACPSSGPNGEYSLVLAAGVLLLLLLPGCLLLCGGPAAHFLSFCGRVLLIQLLPYWDWTLHSNADCLIRNPYYFARGLESLQLTDCINVCQKYPTVESVQKVDPKVVLQKYLRQNLPLVVTDGAEEWVAMREFTVPFLTQDTRLRALSTLVEAYPGVRRKQNYLEASVWKFLYQSRYSLQKKMPWENGVLTGIRMEEMTIKTTVGVSKIVKLFSGHPVLQNTIVCSYWDSHGSLEKSPGAFLEKVHHERLSQWAIQWKNCNKAAAKVIRGFYQRPYFLPSVVELSESNWLLMASQAGDDGTGNIFVKMGDHDGDLLMWIAQLQGVFEVQLLPRDICVSNCTHYTMQLSPGQTVAVPLRMWDVQYRAFSSSAIGLAATGNWLQDSR